MEKRIAIVGSLLYEPDRRIHGGRADHEEGRFGHPDVDVCGYGDSQPEHG